MQEQIAKQTVYAELTQLEHREILSRSRRVLLHQSIRRLAYSASLYHGCNGDGQRMTQLVGKEAIEVAQQILDSSQLYDLRNVHVERHGDSILLLGQLGSYYLKQQAQELLREVACELRLDNQIEVRQQVHVDATSERVKVE